MLEEYKICKISTAHVTKSDDVLLMNPMSAPVRALCHDCGYIVRTGYAGSPQSTNEMLNECESEGFSAAFMKCLEYFRNKDFEFIWFDPDADKQLGLQVFNW